MMRSLKNILSASIIIPICASALILSGCATMQYPSAYKVEGKEIGEFKDLDDDKALKVVALIYNVQSNTWEDGIARSIALEEYLKLLANRNSKYIKSSGIFDMKYEKVKLSSWKDEDLIKLYDTLFPKAENYYMDAAPELSETQNAGRIVCLTAINSIERELKKRNNTKGAIAVAGQVLMTVLTTALSMI